MLLNLLMVLHNQYMAFIINLNARRTYEWNWNDSCDKSTYVQHCILPQVK